MVINWVDFSLFLALLGLFIYMLLASQVTMLHKVYFLFHGAMMLWPIGQFGLSATENPGIQWFYFNVSLVGASFMGAGWLMFSMVLTNKIHSIRLSHIITISLPAVASAVMASTNPWHHLYVTPVNGNYVERLYGPFFWYTVGLSLFYIVYANVLMARSYRIGTGYLFKRQLSVLILGQVLLVVVTFSDVLVNVILLPGQPSIKGLTSLGIFLSDVCFVVAIMRYNVFKLINLAQRDVIDTMTTGIVVVDDENFVIDCNEAVVQFMNVKVGDPFNFDYFLEVSEKEGPSRSFLGIMYAERTTIVRSEVTVGGETKKHVAIQLSPVFDRKRNFLGRVITLTDVTEWRNLVGDLHVTNEDLRQRNNELTRIQDELYHANKKLEQLSVTDSLTGSFNRRYLYQLLEYEIAVEQRYEAPFSLVMLDVDHFKQVNDQFGHVVGDDALRSLAESVRGLLRRSDVLARYGGEEFIIYLPHTTVDNALILCERIRTHIEATPLHTKRGPVSLTVSIGIANVSGGGSLSKEADPREILDGLVAQADAALYEAKKQGRNRIVLAGDRMENNQASSM